MQRGLLLNLIFHNVSIHQIRSRAMAKFKVPFADRLPLYSLPFLVPTLFRPLSSTMTTPAPLPASKLREWVLSRTEADSKAEKGDIPKSFQVVDVRDDDYQGGNIPGAINIPSRQMSYRVDELVEELKDNKVVVFTCALSQQRGPNVWYKRSHADN